MKKSIERIILVVAFAVLTAFALVPFVFARNRQIPGPVNCCSINGNNGYNGNKGENFMTMPKKKHLNYFAGKKYDGMMGRCYRETDTSYKNYGGKGIRVCSSWIKEIKKFREWFRKELENKNISEEDFVLNSRIYQLDRIDAFGHYSPENCRIVSAQENSRNQRNRKFVKIKSAEGEVIEVQMGGSTYV